MKKSMMELSILFLGLGMAMVLGTFAYGGVIALCAFGAEVVMGLLVCRLYNCIQRIERRAERRARRDAQAHHAAQLYRAGVRLYHPPVSAQQPQQQTVPHLRVA
ncbi:MAG: hypothetical protein IJ347_01910 [Faecalibacterium sp.]|nr:hypothetical protein [Faecalibacterium sp.]